ncbi:MAG: hypothetical protein GXY06_06000 [Clostridiaceae bacterium]|nr:hypothetical protein [Clostridiaceae bacterium]
MKSNAYRSNVGIIASKSIAYLLVSLFLVRLIALRLSLDTVRTTLLVIFVILLCLVSFFVSPRFAIVSRPNGITLKYSSGEFIDILYAEKTIRVFTHKIGIAGFPIFARRYLRCISEDGKCKDYPLYHFSKDEFDDFASIIIPASIKNFELTSGAEHDDNSPTITVSESISPNDHTESETDFSPEDIASPSDTNISNDDAVFAAVQFPKKRLLRKITKEYATTVLLLSLPTLIITYTSYTLYELSENIRDNSNMALALNVLIAVDCILISLIIYSICRALNIALHIPQEFRFARDQIKIDRTVFDVSSITSVTLSPIIMSNVDSHRQRTVTIREVHKTSRYYLGHATPSSHSSQFEEYDLVYTCITSVAAIHKIHIIIETY